MRPRRLTETFHVCAIASVESAAFVAADQAVRATLRDRDGNPLQLVHPYTSRSSQGTDWLLDCLERARTGDLNLCFASGSISLTPNGLTLSPVGLVFETGSSRYLLQPWLDAIHSPLLDGDRNISSLSPHPNSTRIVDPIADHLDRLGDCLAEVAVQGPERLDASTRSQWQELLSNSRKLGLTDLSVAIVAWLEVLNPTSTRQQGTTPETAQLSIELSVWWSFAILCHQTPIGV